ncbi:hypothetical protein [Reyranella sp.]|uniref:tetratricopeptide repeat protein n=1 Tax=Reyranella sp. TaxID=1929291 RepID=UPI003BA94B45
MAGLLGDRWTQVLKLVVVGAAAALLPACASDSTSYQEQALRASEGGDLKTATLLAQKEVEKYSATDQCSSTTNYNCGTLALAYSSLAEYQILSGNLAAGERSFDRAKGALQRVPKDNKPSATGMVYRDVSEAYWKAGDRKRAIAIFKEGTTRGADEWLYTSSAAKAVAQQEGRPAPATPGMPTTPGVQAAPGAPVPLGPAVTPAAATEADMTVKSTPLGDPATGAPAAYDATRGRPPSSAEPAPAPLAPSPLTPTPLQRSR